ncbi:hypothetical protein K438DRAFT_1959988 [Mycena galopus ATCC 62051]|nr:hypothetical protein K438DRAFT_1959988 [Mycena galopus ATCC 62051]
MASTHNRRYRAPRYGDPRPRRTPERIVYQTQGLIIPGSGNPFDQPSTCAFLPSSLALRARGVSADGVSHSSRRPTRGLALNGSLDPTQPTWSTNLQGEHIETIDAFSKCDNVLAYNVGNEVLPPGATTAVARDIKAYISSLSTPFSPLTLLVLSRCRPSPPPPTVSFSWLICILILRSPGTSISSALVEYTGIDGTSDFRDAVEDYLSRDPSGANNRATSIDLFELNKWCVGFFILELGES